MLYIITEDANSARDFWSCMAETYLSPGSYELLPLPLDGNGRESAGNTTLPGQVRKAFQRLQKGDTLFVAFDNIGNTKNFSVYDFLRTTEKRCGQKGVHFRYTTYYCFEEVYLSYDELIRLGSRSRYIDEITYVHNCIHQHREYFGVGTGTADFVKQQKVANKEHLANALLIEATKLIPGYFKITKQKGAFEKQAVCWLKSCEEIQAEEMTLQQVENVCRKSCGYQCRGGGTAAKLGHLKEHSLLKDHSRTV